MSVESDVTDLINKAIDKINDQVAKIPEVQQLHKLILTDLIGRSEPRDDEDTEYYNASSQFYTKLFLRCADYQWYWNASAAMAIQNAK